MTGYLEAYYPGGIFVRNRSECIRNGRVTPRRATDHQDSSSIGNLPFWFGRERWPGSVVIRLSYLSSGLPGPDYPDFRRIVPSWGETTHIRVRDCSLSSRVHAGIEPSGKPGQYYSIVRFIFHLREGRSLCKDKAIVPFFAQHCLGSKKLTKCRCGTVT